MSSDAPPHRKHKFTVTMKCDGENARVDAIGQLHDIEAANLVYTLAQRLGLGEITFKTMQKPPGIE